MSPDPIVSTETWRARFVSSPDVPVRVDRHTGADGDYFAAHAFGWPGVPYGLHFGGNSARYAVERLVAGGINNASNDEAGCGFRDVEPPEEVTRTNHPLGVAGLPGPREGSLRAFVQGGGGPVAVSFEEGWTGSAAVAAALAEARGNPGRIVTLLGARHPHDGGEVTCWLAFGVLNEPGHVWHGDVRKAAYQDGGAPPSLTGPGTSRLASADASDAEAAVDIAQRLLMRSWWIFRPVPEAAPEEETEAAGFAERTQKEVSRQ